MGVTWDRDVFTKELSYNLCHLKELDLKKGMVERLEGRCRNLTIDKEQQESILEDLKCQNTKERTERDALNNDLNSEYY